MITFAVRPADPGDRAVVESFEQRVRNEAAKFRGGLVLIDEISGADRRFRASNVLVASEYHGDGIVGVAWMSVDADTCCIESVHVDESARGLGCGRTLVLACRDVAHELGCTRLDSLALPGDRATKNLYERVGMTARRIVASTEL